MEEQRKQNYSRNCKMIDGTCAVSAQVRQDVLFARSSFEVPNKLSLLLRGLLVLGLIGAVGAAAHATNTFTYNPKTLHWKAVNANGKVVRTGRGSGGRHYCPDTGRHCRTPSGVYHVIGKGGAGCKSSRYPVGKGGAPMPYCMYFSKNYAIHGSYEVPNYNASHGCIRILPSDAKWLSNNFVKVGTKVVVQPY